MGDLQQHREMSVSDGEVPPLSIREAPELVFHGKVMKWKPANMTVDHLMYELRTRRAVHVQLEPGDGTRYDLVVTWAPAIAGAFYLTARDAGDFLHVTRVIGGDLIYSMLFGEASIRPAHMPIANGNEWTAVVLAWWLDELLSRLTA
jgi:hypothetical protein